MTFTRWLTTRPHRGHIRHLAEDVRNDQQWPRDASKQQYAAYLYDYGPTVSAVFRRAWKAWKAFDKKARA